MAPHRNRIASEPGARDQTGDSRAAEERTVGRTERKTDRQTDRPTFAFMSSRQAGTRSHAVRVSVCLVKDRRPRDLLDRGFSSRVVSLFGGPEHGG